VYVPVASLQRTAMGYIYAQCLHSDIDCKLRRNRNRISFSNTDKQFDMEGRSQQHPMKVFARVFGRGRRTLRNGVDGVSKETPTVCLSQLLERMCYHLHQKMKQNLNPSLVQLVLNASLLGISFCQIRCRCSHCFSPLVNRNECNGTNYQFADLDEQSFWHLPLPHELESGPSRNVNNNLLRCLNGCPMDTFIVQWECSAVLDDGTGQATMYADGEIVPTLLGMTRQTLQWIETGLQSVSGGCLVFKKTVPPSSTLQNFVKRLMKQPGYGSEKLERLPLPLRAEYLLQRHCRSSQGHPLDVCVRCKPLPDRFCHLQHSSCDSYTTNASDEFMTSETFTYSLPQLKLELVSFGIASTLE
jgi:hypothetical protein